MDDIKVKVDETTLSQKRYRDQEEYDAIEKNRQKKSKPIRKQDRRVRNKGKLEATVEDWESTYFTSPEKLLDEENYVKLISPLLPEGHSMKFTDGTAVIVDVPPRLGFLPYMADVPYF